MIVCGVDVETTGLDPVKNRIIEIGAVHWCTETNKPVRMFSELLRIDPEGEIEEQALRINGLSVDLCEAHGVSRGQAFRDFCDFVEGIDYLVAHNAPFDRERLESEIMRVLETRALLGKKWIDTSADIKYPPEIKTRKLVHVAAELGFLNPFAHRALFDVLTMMRVASHFDWQETIARSEEPNITLAAGVSFHNNNLAKERGYRWHAAPVKEWRKIVKESEVAQEQADAPFPVRQVAE